MSVKTRGFNQFLFTGALKFVGDITVETTTNDKGTITEKHGYMTITKGKSAKGENYVSRKLNVKVVTATGDEQWLDISDYVSATRAGENRTFNYRAKGETKSTAMRYALAKDVATVASAENWMVISLKVGNTIFNCLDIGHLIDFMVEHRAELDGQEVTVTGNVKANEYKGNLQLSYPVKAIRTPYSSEVNGLSVGLDVWYTKNATQQIDYQNQLTQDNPQVPVTLFYPLQVKNQATQAYEHKLLSVKDVFSLDLSMVKFGESEAEGTYSFLQNILNILDTLSPQGGMVQGELEEFKYYKVKFNAKIKTFKKSGELREEDLTTAERFYLFNSKKDLNEIKRDRGIKNQTSTSLILDAIPLNVELDEAIVSSDMYGAKQEATVVSANQAFTQPAMGGFTLGLAGN
ncbi:MAG: hypothetical protein ACRC6E_14455 [Fusobacteriaceae bacterium]